MNAAAAVLALLVLWPRIGRVLWSAMHCSVLLCDLLPLCCAGRCIAHLQASTMPSHHTLRTEPNCVGQWSREIGCSWRRHTHSLRALLPTRTTLPLGRLPVGTVRASVEEAAVGWWLVAGGW